MMAKQPATRGVEELSAVYDGEGLTPGATALNAREQEQVQRWSLIGAALRDELGPQVDLGFAGRVAQRLRQQPPASRFRLPRVNVAVLRRTMLFLTESAVAAAVAVVTVVGWQTFNADNNFTLEEAAATLGQINGLSLAGYQHPTQTPSITFQDRQPAAAAGEETAPAPQLKEDEAARINNYLVGYLGQGRTVR